VAVKGADDAVSHLLGEARRDDGARRLLHADEGEIGVYSVQTMALYSPRRQSQRIEAMIRRGAGPSPSCRPSCEGNELPANRDRADPGQPIAHWGIPGKPCDLAVNLQNVLNALHVAGIEFIPDGVRKIPK
jgi:hypothetical protein